MKNVLKKGMLLLGIYLVFTAYLFLASERMENLDNQEKTQNVTLSSSSK